MKLLDRYLSRELVVPFLAGAMGFITLEIGTVLFNLMDLIVEQRPPAQLILKLLVFRFPLFLVYALPIATLFGVSLGVNRLAREGEITAIRMSGVPLRRVLFPIVVIAVLLSLFSFFISETITPWANRVSMKAERQIYFGGMNPLLEADVFFQTQGYYFYIGHLNRDSKGRYFLRKVMIYEVQPGRYPLLTTAETAQTDGKHWVLYQVNHIELDAQGRVKVQANFQTQEIFLDRPITEYLAYQRQPEEMTARELREQIRLFRASGAPVASLETHYQTKFAIPSACLVLALISFPLALKYARGGTMVGALVSIILFFFYYNTFLLARVMGSSGVVPPVLAAWSPNFLFGGLGLILLWREEAI